MRPEGAEFYGAVTVGERGQVVIPVAARHALDIAAGDKLLIFGGMSGGLMLMKTDQVTAFVHRAMERLQTFQRAAQSGEAGPLSQGKEGELQSGQGQEENK